MEQHPVPQNVTTFQFRLIGDMTLKQFGYLCAGGVLAIICYKLPLPFFFTWPLATAFGLLGIGFAFVPIEERPMDVWVFSFFKSIYSPTQYIWQKGHAPTIQNTSSPTKTSSAPTTTVSKTAAAPPLTPSVATIYAPQSKKATTSMLDQLFEVFGFSKKNVSSAPPFIPTTKPVTGVRPAAPSVTETKPPVAPVADDHKIKELEAAIAQLQSQLSTKTVQDNRVLELQKQLTDVLKEKTHTDDELVRLKRQSENLSHENQTPKEPVKEPVGETTSAPTIKPFGSIDAGVRAGIPRFTNVPNVITGIVKDDTGGFLPAILITVTNADGIPMRALKTNKLGQLAASTPLANGVYIIEIEDPRGRFTFDRIQVTLNGSVVPALEIKAKSQKQVVREKMAQDIFGKPPM